MCTDLCVTRGEDFEREFVSLGEDLTLDTITLEIYVGGKITSIPSTISYNADGIISIAIESGGMRNWIYTYMIRREQPDGSVSYPFYGSIYVRSTTV